MAWTNIANANLDVGAPLRSVDILALRDNITALANGDTGAPPIKAAAFGSGQTGNAPIFAPRAWINFDGTGTFTPNPSTSKIRASGNVSSVAKNTQGDYTVNFSTAMTDINYSVSGIAQRDSTTDGLILAPYSSTSNSSFLTGSIRIRTNNSNGVVEDGIVISLMVLR